jgi:hypothetical protein
MRNLLKSFCPNIANLILSTLAIIVATTITLTTATAHGPTRQKVTKKVEVNASPEKVWAVIKNFDSFNWHPAVEKTTGKGGNAIDATRQLILIGGATIVEGLY